MKAVLQTRMMGGDPPESFQVHLGGELLGTYVAADQMEPLDRPLRRKRAGTRSSPSRLIDIASYEASPTPCR